MRTRSASPRADRHASRGEDRVESREWREPTAPTSPSSAAPPPGCATIPAGRAVGVARDEDVLALAVLLDLLATEVPHLDAAVRREVVEACRQALG